MGKIGIMGGTFNPIHNGHLMLAQYALEENNLDEIWFIPTGCSYMKKDQGILPGEERFHMVELAVTDNPRMYPIDIEIKREGYTYSYETLEMLNALYPEHQFYFIFGADCLFSIENWKCPQEIFDNCTIIAAVRSGASMEQMEAKKEELLNKFQGNIILMPFLQLEISSTLIRERLAMGKDVRYMLPESVLQYITDKHFYER